MKTNCSPSGLQVWLTESSTSWCESHTTHRHPSQKHWFGFKQRAHHPNTAFIFLSYTIRCTKGNTHAHICSKSTGKQICKKPHLQLYFFSLSLFFLSSFFFGLAHDSVCNIHLSVFPFDFFVWCMQLFQMLLRNVPPWKVFISSKIAGPS